MALAEIFVFVLHSLYIYFICSNNFVDMDTMCTKISPYQNQEHLKQQIKVINLKKINSE